MRQNNKIPKNHWFTWDELKAKLDTAVNKTLGEIDVKNVFQRTKANPKITGIAGDVVEQSLLGYDSDSDQRPDILIDNVPYEVKTTGLRIDVTEKNAKKAHYVAKEPMSITNVSLESIHEEVFETSHFWEKASKLLLIFYLYKSKETVKASDYAYFPIVGYNRYTFSKEDQKVLKKDWETIRDFIVELRKQPNPKKEYPRLSSELRSKLLYLDTAPKYPHSPRFRLKRSLVTQMVKTIFREFEVEDLPDITSVDDLTKVCQNITASDKGKSVKELIEEYGIKLPATGKIGKNISEQIIVRMFGGKQKKLSRIGLFSKAGIVAKSIVLSSKQKRTEDNKLFTLDFDDFFEKDFEESEIREYFAQHQFLYVVFEEKDKEQKFEDNVFKGFVRITFDDSFIDEYVKPSWTEIHDVIVNHKLSVTSVFTKDGKPRINKNGVHMEKVNLPKSSEFNVFVRGTGKDSTNKYMIQGVRMYHQQLWLKGSFVVELIKKHNYL